ncbi:lipopolysaccharide assembly protein LapA domain-containing protein [Flocculibacter collagenilyticus]|uniref:lipopolysaccharide assembly protein LapA domain-containing protein n=1 Tax=Flocculibacter collagenilyticus TaxID=2744479 RepID=UPI0018F33FE3|nr:lipopolysaccharide assembly protein LapA domain-containing protein [Flocculibacter collagenilyticus]
MRKFLLVILYLFLILLALSFGLLNKEQISVNYLVGSATLTISELVSIIFFTGLFVGLITANFMVAKLSIKKNKIEKENNKLKVKLEKLESSNDHE